MRSICVPDGPPFYNKAIRFKHYQKLDESYMGLEPRGGLSVKKTNWFLAKISEVLKTEEDKCAAFVSLMAHHLNLIHE